MFQSIENMIVFDIKSTRCIINQILLEMISIYIKFNIKLLFFGGGLQNEGNMNHLILSNTIFFTLFISSELCNTMLSLNLRITGKN